MRGKRLTVDSAMLYRTVGMAVLVNARPSCTRAKACIRSRTLTLPAGSLMPSALVPQLTCPAYTYLLTELGLNQLTPVIFVTLGSNLLRGYPIPCLNPSATRS